MKRSRLLFAAFTALALPFAPHTARADENLFGYTRGAETLPAGAADFYNFLTLREGKDSGTYNAWDLDTEYEYGVTDQLQFGAAIVQHYFHVEGNEELGSFDQYRFGGVELNAKYRILSPFKDAIGLAFRNEVGFLRYDDVGGIIQQQISISPEFIFQKNFLDDTLITALNLGIDFSWGKKPAEEYEKEVSLEAAFGVSYRFAPNWFLGFDSRLRSEYPNFDFGFHEHTVVFIGPALHYGGQSWWATASWGYQIYGKGVDEDYDRKTFAEEARNEFRLKLGFNFGGNHSKVPEIASGKSPVMVSSK